jgi:hypothetical protein
MEGKPLPERQHSYLDTVLGRLRADEFELTEGTTAAPGPEYGFLPPKYLWVGKRLKYSPLSVIGYIEDAVLIGSFERVDLDTMAAFARRAREDALARRSRFKFIFPVVSVRVLAVLLADEVTNDVTDHLRANGAPLDLPNKAILFPVVFDAATSKIDYYRKVAMFGSVEVQGCQSRAEALFTP